LYPLCPFSTTSTWKLNSRTKYTIKKHKDKKCFQSSLISSL
jgi:hypothetical protein